MVNPYAAAPIDSDENEIRLVRLNTVTISDTINCTLRSYSLDTNGLSYVALSYCWGSKERYKDIIVNGVPYAVGRNLWSFLDRTRRQARFKDALIWIDALCINQLDVGERNHQVRLMRDIYSGAHTVWVWLGEKDASSDRAMRLLKLREQDNETGQFSKLWKAKQAEAILQLCNRNYWRRIWIVQEIMLAAEAIIMCGEHNVPWFKLQQLIDALQNVSDRGRATHVSRAIAILESHAANIVRAKSKWDGSQTLITLLALYRDQQATDSLDMVYALHGLASDSTSLDVNYSINRKTLLINLLHHVVPLGTQSIDARRMKKEIARFGHMMNDILKVGLLEDNITYLVNATIARLDDNLQEGETLDGKDEREADAWRARTIRSILESDETTDFFYLWQSVAPSALHETLEDDIPYRFNENDRRWLLQLALAQRDYFRNNQAECLSGSDISWWSDEAMNPPSRSLMLHNPVDGKRLVVRASFGAQLKFNFVAQRLVNRFQLATISHPSLVKPLLWGDKLLLSTDEAVHFAPSADDSNFSIRFHVVEESRFDVLFSTA